MTNIEACEYLKTLVPSDDPKAQKAIACLEQLGKDAEKLKAQICQLELAQGGKGAFQ